MREMTLPPIVNQRSPEQWSIIRPHVDFDGKTVLDLGCGFADLMWRIWQAGAKSVVGIDSDPDILAANRIVREKHLGPFHNVVFYEVPIEDVVMGDFSLDDVDVTLCFSVLPYLDAFANTLRWMRGHSAISLVECQLHNDGPGLEFIETDKDIYNILANVIGWTSVDKLGETIVKGRDASRSIWMCTDTGGVKARNPDTLYATWSNQ